MPFQRFFLFISMVFMLNFGAWAQKIGFYIEGEAKKVVIPFKTYNNLIVIPLTVNDKYPLRFIVDTGVRATIFFDKNITDIFNAPYLKRIQLQGVGDLRDIVAYIGAGIDFSYYNLRSSDMSFLVLAEDYINLRNHLGTDVHGIVGYDFFSRFVVHINYATEELILIKPEYFREKKRYRTIPLEIEDTKPYVNIPLFINDSTKIMAHLMVDTGASHALVLHADSVGPIQLPVRNIKTVLGRGLGGEILGSLAYIDGCEIGDYKLENIIASFPQWHSYSDSLLLTSREGTIGGEILNKFNVIFDYENEQMYLKKNGKFSVPFEYNMSGFEVTAEGKDLDQFKIHLVRKGSPADMAGVCPGDYIVELNSWSREELELPRIYKTLSSKDGRWINMIVSRNGVLVKIRFRLKKEI